MILAVENFDKALALEPGNMGISTSRIIVDFRLGKFDNGDERFLELLKFCTTGNDSSTVYNSLSDYYELKGQSDKALYYHKKYVKSLEKVINPLNHMMLDLFNIEKYILAGQVEEASQILKEAESKLQPPVDKVVSFGYMFYYIEVDSAEQAEKYIQEAKDLAISFGEEMLFANIHYAEGRIGELKNDYKMALEGYTKYHDYRPLEISAYRLMAKCYRNLGDLKES